MVLFAGFMALEILRTDLTNNVATTPHLVVMVLHERLEGELTFRANRGLLLADLLTTWWRHYGDDGDDGGDESKGTRAAGLLERVKKMVRVDVVENRSGRWRGGTKVLPGLEAGEAGEARSEERLSLHRPSFILVNP